MLFPNVQLQLQILEPRFQKLITQCWERGSEFGICLMHNGVLQSVGCSAVVTEIFDNTATTFNVIIEGRKRFLILDVMGHAQDFSMSQVQLLYDNAVVTDASLLMQCIALYNQTAAIVFGRNDRIDVESLHDASAAFLMAPKCGLSNQQKQALLELDDENERLAMLIAVMTEMLPVIQKAETVRQLIMRDGYIS